MKIKEAMDILELTNISELKKNYHRLAVKYHPDKNGNSEQFILIKEAYDLLSKENDIIFKFNEYTKNDLRLSPMEYFSMDHLNLEQTYVHITDPSYFFENKTICYSFKISLKESLIGFVKKWIDPFEKEHTIVIKTIVKNGDGIVIYVNEKKLILVFKINYPKQLPTELINSIKLMLT